MASCTSFSYGIAANFLNKFRLLQILVPEVAHLLWRASINSSSWGGRRFSVDSLSTYTFSQETVYTLIGQELRMRPVFDVILGVNRHFR